MMKPVNGTATIEFPWVSELPKREKSKLAKMWDRLAELRQVSEQKGQLLPHRFVGRLLDVSNTRVQQLVESGKLERVDIDGHPFITENSLRAYAQTERKAGRPPKVPSNGEVWKLTKDFLNS